MQTCIVHLVRHSLNFCSWKDRKAVAARLREVYSAENAEAAREALETFDADWGGQYPSIAQAWRRAWEEVIPFFAFSPEIRRVIYTTNAMESLNRVIRKAIKTRGSFPSEQAAEKLIYLAIRGHEKTSRNGERMADSGEPVRHNVRGSLHPDAGLRAVMKEPGRQPDTQNS